MYCCNRSCENGFSNKSRAACECAFVQSDLRATLSTDTSQCYLFCRKADRVALRLDCADAQADLELHCPDLFEDLLSHDASQFMIISF